MIWIIVMIGSTLLPTMVHLCFAALGLMTLAPRARWERMIKKQDGPPHTVAFKIWFPIEAGALTALAAAIPIGLGTLLWYEGGHLVDLYAQIIRDVADAMGLLTVGPDWKMPEVIDV